MNHSTWKEICEYLDRKNKQISKLATKRLTLVIINYDQQKEKEHSQRLGLHLTTGKSQQDSPKTSSSQPFLGRETQQLHEQWNSRNPYCRVYSFPCKLESHLPKEM